ncbi:MAG: hypothetical protein JSR92_12815 [Proteobacteria bacterium]|nr:hypothetical protein [Pseudomonadota bacterium]
MSAVPAFQPPPSVSDHRHSARLMNAAIAIADACVRSEIECFAVGSEHGGQLWWNLDDTEWRDAESRTFAQASIARAVRYIELRSPDAFPWTLLRHPERPELVRFEDKAQP